MDMNKILAAFLIAGIVTMGVGYIAEGLVHPEELEETAIFIDVAPPEDAVAEAEPEPVDIAVLLASADAAAGEGQFRACAACHNREPGGGNGVGPNLWNLVGGPIAAVDGFNYSSALQDHGASVGAWTYEQLNGFLAAPRDWVPGTSMSYAGLRSDENRANLIAYLRTLADDPIPLP